MKKVAIQDAVGLRLCHDITEIREGFKGVAFKRDTVIREEDIEHFLNIGKRHVFVWDDSTNNTMDNQADTEYALDENNENTNIAVSIHFTQKAS